MLEGLSYTVREIRTWPAGHKYGHMAADIRSEHSSLPQIWTVDTSHAMGGPKKHAELIHVIAKRFIEAAKKSEHWDAFADCFEEERPALFMFYDGGEDPSETPTKVVCIQPQEWHLLGDGANPGHICYVGTVYFAEGEQPPYRDGCFWTKEWMEQTTMDEVEKLFPKAASQIREALPNIVFSTPASGHRNEP